MTSIPELKKRFERTSSPVQCENEEATLPHKKKDLLDLIKSFTKLYRKIYSDSNSPISIWDSCCYFDYHNDLVEVDWETTFNYVFNYKNIIATLTI